MRHPEELNRKRYFSSAHRKPAVERDLLDSYDEGTSASHSGWRVALKEYMRNIGGEGTDQF